MSMVALQDNYLHIDPLYINPSSSTRRVQIFGNKMMGWRHDERIMFPRTVDKDEWGNEDRKTFTETFTAQYHPTVIDMWKMRKSFPTQWSTDLN